MRTATYTIRAGDTLSEIATAHHTTIAELIHLNPRYAHHPNYIAVGDKILVPTSKPTAPHTTAPTPYVVRHAMDKANNTHHWPRGMCDNFCAEMYGYAHSGYNTAVANWAAIPKAHKHPGSFEAPKGAVIFYGGGSTGAGHATLSEGVGTGKGRKQRSIDMHDGRYTPGDVDTVTTQQVLGWGTLHYLGWADPYFAGHLVAKVG